MSRRPPPNDPAVSALPTAFAAGAAARARSRHGALAGLAAALLLLPAPAFAQNAAPGRDPAEARDAYGRPLKRASLKPAPTTSAAPRPGLSLRGSLGSDRPAAGADDLPPLPGAVPSAVADTLLDPDPAALEPIGRPRTAASGPARPAGAAEPGTDGTAAPRPPGRIDPLTGKPLVLDPAAGRGPVEAVTRTGSVKGGPTLAAPAVQPRPRDAQADKREEAVIEDDEYAQLGLRTGGFTWLPAIESSAGWSSNIASRAGGASGLSYRIAPELLGKSDWSRHSLQIELRGAYLGNTTDRDYDRPSAQAAVRGRVDLGDETRLDLKGTFSHDRQAATSVDNPLTTAVPATVETKTGSLGLTRDVGLLALTLRGDIERADYTGGTTVTGASLGSDIQNNTRLIGALRATYGSPSSIRPFAEVQVSTRAYDDAVVAGSPRDSTGAAVKGGLTADLGPRLRGEISTGWGVERPDKGPLPDMSAWLVDASLVWSPTRLTTVKLDAKTSFEPTTLTAATGSVSRTAAIQVDHALRRNLVASAGVALTDRRYVGVTQREDDLVLSSGLTYKIDRNLQTFVKGSLERFNSSVVGADYNAATVMVGVRVQR